MSVWHSLYHRDIIVKNNIRFISERNYASEDIPFQIDFLNHCSKVVFIPDILYCYCYNQGSLTKSFTIEKFYKIKALYHILFDKSKAIDKKGLRVKRLFLGYTRAMIRLISSLPITQKEKIDYIRTIIKDDIWNDFKKTYKPSFLPIHQRIMTFFIYRGSSKMTYIYAKIMNLKN